MNYFYRVMINDDLNQVEDSKGAFIYIYFDKKLSFK